MRKNIIKRAAVVMMAAMMIIIDSKGTVHDAVELDEDAAREYVAKTLGG